jgi:hypothetical protein
MCWMELLRVGNRSPVPLSMDLSRCNRCDGKRTGLFFLNCLLFAFYTASGSTALEHLHLNLPLSSPNTCRRRTPSLGASNGLMLASIEHFVKDTLPPKSAGPGLGSDFFEQAFGMWAKQLWRFKSHCGCCAYASGYRVCGSPAPKEEALTR